MYETWLATGEMPPRPTKYAPGLMDSWMELTADFATLTAFKELREERKKGKAR